MEKADIQKLAVGTEVFWNDPEQATSGIHEVLRMSDMTGLTKEGLEEDDFIVLIGNGYSEAEVSVQELEAIKDIQLLSTIKNNRYENHVHTRALRQGRTVCKIHQ